MGLAVFCHEFGHALGLPDFYCTDYSYSNDDAFSNWSIMDTGAYIDDYCRKPMGYTAYEKSYMGWLELKEFGDASEVTLQSPLGEAENSAYILRNSSNETFIFENRQPGTWYPSAYGSGMMVSRIAYSYNYWSNNTLNNTKSKKRACILTANGAKLYYSASSANLYGNTKKSITTLQTLSGSSKTVDIKNIAKNSNGTITLTLKEGGDAPDPKPTPAGTIFYESFDQCSGKGGNDGQWSNINSQAAFVVDNDGWEAEGNKAYGAYQCAKFGTGSVVGSATTPAFTVSGTAILTFKAGAWDASKDGTSLILTVSKGSISPNAVTTEKGKFNEFTATITAKESTTVTFMTEAGRFFLDEVKVESVMTGIDTLEVEAATTNRIYTLDGRYIGKTKEGLSRGLYIMNGKKVFICN